MEPYSGREFDSLISEVEDYLVRKDIAKWQRKEIRRELQTTEGNKEKVQYVLWDYHIPADPAAGEEQLEEEEAEAEDSDD